MNSIRQVDQANVETAANRQLAAIQTLAAQTSTNAEHLRSALATTAQAIAVQTASTVSQINDRFGALEKAAYKGEGKEAVADPMIAELLREMKMLRTTASTGEGKTQGMTAMWALIASGALFIGSLITIGTFVFITTRPPQLPSVIYTPAPTGTQLPSTLPRRCRGDLPVLHVEECGARGDGLVLSLLCEVVGASGREERLSASARALEGVTR